MAQFQMTNFGDSVLAAGITPGDTSISIATGTGSRFPALAAGDWFYAVLVDTSANREIIKVTARTTDTLTATRAQEGTTALSFAVGSVLRLTLTKQAFEDYVAAVALTAAGAATLSNKTVDNSNTITVKDANFTLQDDADVTKQVKFQLNDVSTGQTRVVTMPDADFTAAGTDVAQNWTASQRSAPITDNDGAFDLSGAGNNYTSTPASAVTITFTNIAANAGKSGYLTLVNTSNYAFAAHADTKITAADLAKIGVTGTHKLPYLCDGSVVDILGVWTRP